MDFTNIKKALEDTSRWTFAELDPFAYYRWLEIVDSVTGTIIRSYYNNWMTIDGIKVVEIKQEVDSLVESLYFIEKEKKDKEKEIKLQATLDKFKGE